jgi:zinc protease
LSPYIKPHKAGERAMPIACVTITAGTLRIAGRFLLPLLAMMSVSLAPSLAGQDKSNTQIAEMKLDNGLQIVVIPDRRAPVVTHMIWYKVGSADESPGKSGIAHFFEHLMFKGTRDHTGAEFSQKIAEVGGQENAFTSYDYTAYFQRIPPEALETMMYYEADRMRNLVLTDDVIAPERDVVLEERRSRVENDPGSLLREEAWATLFQNHPYRIPVIGWKHEIEQLNREDAIAFYERYYAPNNAILVVAGDVTPEAVREMAEKTYGKIPAVADLPARDRPREPEQNTKRVVELADPRVSQPSFQKRWVVPSYRLAEPLEAESIDLLSEILGGGARSRLYKQVVVEQGLASQAGAYYQGTSYDDSTFTIWGSPRGSATLEEVEAAIDTELARIAAEAVDEKELEKAKNRLIKRMIFARDDQSSMARIYGASLASGETVEQVNTWQDKIRSVSAEQVQQAAARYLKDSRSVTSYLLPPRDRRS